MYNKLFCIVATLALMTGCATDELADMNEQSGGPAINFGVTAVSTDKLSRGGSTSISESFTLKSSETTDTLAVVVETSDRFIEEGRISRGVATTADNFNSFEVYAFHYAGATATSPTLFFQETVTKQDVSTWTTGTLYYWPTDESQLAFFGMSPAVNNDFLRFEGDQIPADESTAVISYDAPGEPEDQPDLVVASADKVNNNETGEAVAMEFKHILSQVKFVVGTEMQKGTINSITLTNIVKHGDYHYNSGDWVLGEDRTDYTINLDKGVDEVSDGAELGVAEQTLMMLPQTLGEDCKMRVTFTPDGSNESKTLTASIVGEWSMGGSTVYRINIGPEYKLNFVEESLPTEALDCHFVTHTINVNAEELKGKNWTISSDQSWCTFRDQLHGPENQGFWIKSPTGYPAEVGSDATWKAEYDKYKKSGNMEMSATGSNIPVYVFLEDNNGEDARDATLKLTVDGKVVASTTITQLAPIVAGNYLMENVEEETDLPWGFNWNRKVVYEGIKGDLGTYVFSNIYAYIYKRRYGDYQGISISRAGNLVEYIYVKPVITIDYSLMKPDDNLDSTNGDRNTYTLYTNAGGNVLGLESSINSLPDYFKKTSESGTLENSGNYAALSCIKKNAFDIYIEQQSGNRGETVYEGSVSVIFDDVKWYLPASGQSGAFPTSGGDYWSSTPATDNSTAYMMIGGGSATSTQRSVLGRVRAVRNRN